MTERTDDLGSRTFAAGRWKLLTVASKVALYVLVLAVLARFVLPEEFGIVALANIVIAFAIMFSNAGLGPALIQRNHITPTHVRVGFTSGVLLALALWAVIWVAAPTIAVFFREEEVTWVLRIIGASFVFLSFGLVSRALLERALDFRRLMLADLGSWVGFGVVGVAAAVAGHGVWALVAATLTQRLVFSHSPNDSCSAPSVYGFTRTTFCPPSPGRSWVSSYPSGEDSPSRGCSTSSAVMETKRWRVVSSGLAPWGSMNGRTTS